MDLAGTAPLGAYAGWGGRRGTGAGAAGGRGDTGGAGHRGTETSPLNHTAAALGNPGGGTEDIWKG